jgi:hypothetical protein
MTTTTRRDVIDAALALAEDAAQGRCDPAELESDVAAVCRELFGDVRGPEDPLWGVQLDVCRGVLGARGIPADELAEWLAVARRATATDETSASGAPEGGMST